jgi:23S rRNA pseudouridine2605 synthase
VFPVGRLDKETTGLILLTNDGDWANCVTHPRYGIEKEYAVLVRGHPGEDVLARLREGVELPDGTRTAPAQVWQMGGTASETWLRLVVIEGKKRQIRLMLVAVGHPVIALRRVRVGRIELGQLGEGRWRYLTEQEVESVRDAGPGKHSGAGA